MLEKERFRVSAMASPQTRRANADKSKVIIKGLRRELANARHMASVLIQKLITVQERHISAQEEIMRLHKEVHKLQLSKREAKGLGDPLAGPFRLPQS